MGYLDELRAIEAGKRLNDEPTKPTKPPESGEGGGSVGFVSDPVRQISDVKAALGDWHDKLSGLDAEAPPDCINRQAWAQLCLDSWWLYEAHASYAVRNGWTAQSLFGVDTDNPPAGGLAQLLQSSRSVVFDGPRAKVRSWGVTFDRNATWAAGCPLIWELGQ